KVTVDGQEFSVSDDFKHISRALATALEVGEIEASKILLSDSGTDIAADLDFIATAVGAFHERRDLILQNLRLLLQESQNIEVEEHLRKGLLDAIKFVLDTNDGVVGNASLYIKKCLETMKAMESRHLTLSNQLQNRQIADDLARPEYFSILEFQRSSFFKQHEALG
ncbi:MAG: hypothetical protein M1823_008045, partial [Watsoniomyces obsoletus]